MGKEKNSSLQVASFQTMSTLGHFQILVFLCALLIFSAESRKTQLLNDNDNESFNNGVKGTRWAVLISGSKDYINYRHQADICHAYQILRKGGLKDENIIVFMYDDIAFSSFNPRPGVIINKPDGEDVYQGVPKDYTSEAVNVENFYNVLLGNKSGVTGGSGKVLKSGPNDNVFIYYADHGAAGFLGMPNEEDNLIASDFNKVLEKMHKLKRYNKMVIYVEACESGSMFEGILKENLNILAVTAANSKESSFGTYCPGLDTYPPPAPEYDTCLGDVFSISWLEDSDLHDMSKETLKQQYRVVKRRTGADVESTSHVCHFGTNKLLKDYLGSYIGTNPENQNFTFTGFTSSPNSNSGLVNPRDIPLLYLQRKILKAPLESPERKEAEKKLFDEMNHRKQIDQSIVEILRLSLKKSNVLDLLTSTRSTGQPLVDDWDCFKILVKSFKSYCGATVEYGLKYTGALANVCNMGVDVKHTVSAIEQACSIK